MSQSTFTDSDTSDRPGLLGFDEETEGLDEYAKYMEASTRHAKKQHEDHLSKAEDVHQTLENIHAEVPPVFCGHIPNEITDMNHQLQALAMRTGIRTLLLSARGRYEDLVEPTIRETGEAMDFIRTVFDMDMSELAARLDAWAVTKGGTRAHN
ncbi:hypothetical protein B0H13DRAFT_1857525 [Mycena leptocephala]|nr:hypothetical protein B0H13DRAFT_1857525 [Mycena leptocephala]